MEIHAEVKFKNGLLYRAVQKIGSQKALAEYLNVSPTMISYWLQMRECPRFREGRYKIRQDRKDKYAEIDLKLITLIGYSLEEVFPLEVDSDAARRLATRRHERIINMPISELAGMGAIPQLPKSPFDEVAKHEFNELLYRTLDEIESPRNVDILKMRCGLLPYDREYTLEETGAKHGVTRERVRQIEARVMRWLRHPTRSKAIKAAIPDSMQFETRSGFEKELEKKLDNRSGADR